MSVDGLVKSQYAILIFLSDFILYNPLFPFPNCRKSAQEAGIFPMDEGLSLELVAKQNAIQNIFFYFFIRN